MNSMPDVSKHVTILRTIENPDEIKSAPFVSKRFTDAALTPAAVARSS